VRRKSARPRNDLLAAIAAGGSQSGPGFLAAFTVPSTGFRTSVSPLVRIPPQVSRPQIHEQLEMGKGKVSPARPSRSSRHMGATSGSSRPHKRSHISHLPVPHIPSSSHPARCQAHGPPRLLSVTANCETCAGIVSPLHTLIGALGVQPQCYSASALP
jgi:hypothetical protein